MYKKITIIYENTPMYSHQHRPKQKYLQREKNDVDAMQYGETLSASLILYANRDEMFKKELKKLLDNMDRPRGGEALPEIRNDVEILMPPDSGAAFKRAEWLVDRIDNNAIPGAANAGAMLKEWAENEPKQIVVGVVQIAVPGITLGRVKRRRKVSLILRKSTSKKLNIEFAEKVSRACLGIMSRALVVADGNASELEPEIAEWFFGDREIDMYSAEIEEMKNIENKLFDLDILYSTIYEDDEPAIIAISPAVHSAYQTELWKLHKLNT